MAPGPVVRQLDVKDLRRWWRPCRRGMLAPGLTGRGRGRARGLDAARVPGRRRRVISSRRKIMGRKPSDQPSGHGAGTPRGGARFLRVMPRPGHRAAAYVAPNMVFTILNISRTMVYKEVGHL